MKKWISILSGLLFAQLVLVMAVHLSAQDYGAFEGKEKLLGLDDRTIDHLLIEGDNSSVSLKKTAGSWVLSDEGNFPASQKSVNDLLDKLAGLERGWPVATSNSASRRFKVAQDQYHRKLTLYSADEVVARLFVGSSPGVRKVHLRANDDEAIYVAEFKSWETGAQVDDWLDKAVLQLEEADIGQLDIAEEISLKSEDGKLQLTGLTEQESTNESEAFALVRKLAGLAVQSLKSEEESAPFKQQQPDFKVSVTLTNGERLNYQFFKASDSQYVLKRSDLDRYFEVASYLVKPIIEASRERLVNSNESKVDGVSKIKTSQDGEGKSS
jgi:hypothetical protein